jgi:hypothetical protein
MPWRYAEPDTVEEIIDFVQAPVTCPKHERGLKGLNTPDL